MGFDVPKPGGPGGGPGTPGSPGVSVTGASIDGSGHLILTLSSGATVDAGVATGPAGPGVPAGGTTGQRLQKTSGTDYATSWVTPSTLPGHVVAPPLSTWWKFNNGQPGTLTPAAAGAMYLFPVLLPAVTLQALAVEVSAGAASSFVRLGLYADNAGAGPLLSSAPLWDGGQIDASTPGIKTFTVSGGLTLAGGVYWIAVVSQGAVATLRAGIGGGLVQVPLPPGQSPTISQAVQMWAVTGVTGNLPSTAGNTPSQQNTNVPYVWFQRSAT